MKRLQTQITTGRFTLPAAVFLTIICWAGVYILIPELPAGKTAYSFWNDIESLLPGWSERLLGLLLSFVIGYFLIIFNNVFGLIRIRASVQTAIFLLFVTACPFLHNVYAGDLAAIAVLFAIYNLFKCYQCQRPMGYVFNAFVFLGFGSLIFPQLTFFFPVFLIGISNIQALNLRSLLAAIIGWSVPYWFLFAYAYFFQKIELFYQPFIELSTFQPFSMDSFKHPGWIAVAYFFIIFIISAIHCFVDEHKDKIRTRIYLRFIILFVFCLFLLIFLQPAHIMNVLSILLAGVSILAGHLFVLTNSKASNLLFISAVIGLIGLFVFNTWMLL